MALAAREALRTVGATRYVAPLREGGSLPGLVEADDDGLYVAKFTGAGQGPRALVAEVVAGELGRALGLRVPELVVVELDPELGRAEPDPEIQDLLRASPGPNLGVDFLPGALPPPPAPAAPPDLAAAVVWFDALTLNVDRTPRNPNLLVWHGHLWLIDHGAALYPHHAAGAELPAHAERAFPAIAEHVLLPAAGPIAGELDERLAARLTPDRLEAVVARVPEPWLRGGPPRAAYVELLRRRLTPPRAFAAEAEEARARR